MVLEARATSYILPLTSHIFCPPRQGKRFLWLARNFVVLNHVAKVRHRECGLRINPQKFFKPLTSHLCGHDGHGQNGQNRFEVVKIRHYK